MSQQTKFSIKKINTKHNEIINQTLRNKINKRVLEIYEKSHVSDDFNNVNIREDILEKLLPYQTLHVFNMITAVKNNACSVDCSSTGTGKTYTTIATCAQLKLVPFIICQKNNISTWHRVINYFGIEYVTVVNYECIRVYNYLDTDNKKTVCPYITKENGTYKWDFSTHPNGKKIVIIFDEVHKCKSHKTLNGKLLIACKSANVKTIMLSATLCDKNGDFGSFGMMLGFYKTYKHGKSWIESIIREDRNQFGRNKTNTLHKYLFPDKGSKMSLEDLGEKFPMNQITTDCYNLDANSLKKINNLYEQIQKHIYHEDNGTNKLIELNTMRKNVENIKVSEIILNLMMDYYEQNRSVVIFVNYLSSHALITNYLKQREIQYAEIHGEQDYEEREHNINQFQNNEVRIIVCMIQAGGTSISLHDVSGRFPRVSIISPSYSRVELIQTLGRIYRAGMKSPCLQKIVYCADTCEEGVANILQKKKNMLDAITDDDVNIETKLVNLVNKRS
jgi:superfamily II DNA or RNA helicase